MHSRRVANPICYKCGSEVLVNGGGFIGRADLAGKPDMLFVVYCRRCGEQANILARLLPSPQKSGPLLDCACGIGTQTLGLAGLGVDVEGTDISPVEVEWARRDASSLGLTARFRVDDTRTLSTSPIDRYGAVLCMDNSLPHLDSDAQIMAALQAMRKCLKSDGVLL